MLQEILKSTLEKFQSKIRQLDEEYNPLIEKLKEYKCEYSLFYITQYFPLASKNVNIFRST